MTHIRTFLRILLALAFAYAGYAHIANPAPFLAITPDWVPFPEAVIFWTGGAELLGAAGLLVPPSLVSWARPAAAIGLAAYTVCVYPANINHAIMDLTDGTGLPLAYHLPRLLFQPIIFVWCLWAGGILDFRKRRETAA